MARKRLIKVRVIEIYSKVYEVMAVDFKDAVDKLETWIYDEEIDIPATKEYDYENKFYPASETEEATSTAHIEWNEFDGNESQVNKNPDKLN